jgi:hypothetical protein
MSSTPSNSSEAAPEDNLSSRSSPRTRKGGPRTVAGKRAVSQNATKHAITSNNPVAGGEDQAQWESFRDDFVAYYEPVGAPEEVLVNKLTLAHWVQFRITRAEVDSINRQHDALEERARNQPQPPYQTLEEKMLTEAGCDIKGAVDLLDGLTKIDSSARIGWQQQHAGALIIFCSLNDHTKTPTEELDMNCGLTAGSLREWISRLGSDRGQTFEELVALAVKTGREILARQALRVENIEKSRIKRASVTLLPTQGEMDKFIKYDAHQERKIRQTLAQLEILQRNRSGEDLLPPLRVTISED